MPVKHITIPYLSAEAITMSSRTEPPGSATYFTPLLFARAILSSKGKNASLPSVTPSILERNSLCSSLENTEGETREVDGVEYFVITEVADIADIAEDCIDELLIFTIKRDI